MVILIVSFEGCQQPGYTGGNRGLLDRLSSPLGKWSRRRPPYPEAPPTMKLSTRQKNEVRIAMARSMEQKGQTEQAIKVYSEIIRKDRRCGEAYHRLAILHERKGNAAKSAKYYKAALKQIPKSAKLHADFGYSHYLRQQWEQAESHLREALRLNPQLVQAHTNLGLVLGRTGRTEEALREFTRAGCSEADARANLAFSLMMEERWQEARHQLQLALKADPNSKASREGLDTLRSLMAKSKHGGGTSPNESDPGETAAVNYVAQEPAPLPP